jgi:hypothetical protein
MYVKYRPIRNTESFSFRRRDILMDSGPCAYSSNHKILWCNLFSKFLNISQYNADKYDKDEMNQWSTEVLNNIISLIYKTETGSDLEKSILEPTDIILIGLVYYRMLIECIFFRQLCMKGGCDDYLIKTKDFLMFLNTIFYVMGMKGLIHPNTMDELKAIYVLSDVDRTIELILSQKSKTSKNWDYGEDVNYDRELSEDSRLVTIIGSMINNVKITIEKLQISE